jgi:tRNA1(Val) A37 N6-methylase TrmN6
LAPRGAGLALVLVEIDAALAGLARGNAEANAVAADVVVLDLTASAADFAGAGLLPDSADVVMMNPPFNDPARHKVSPVQGRAIAHVATAATLDGWVHAARRLLKSGGLLCMIWRADGLVDVLSALGRGFGSLAILPVHGEPAAPAIRVLLRATKGGKSPTRLYPSLLLNDESGLPSKQVQDVLAGTGVLALATE